MAWERRGADPPPWYYWPYFPKWGLTGGSDLYIQYGHDNDTNTRKAHKSKGLPETQPYGESHPAPPDHDGREKTGQGQGNHVFKACCRVNRKGKFALEGQQKKPPVGRGKSQGGGTKKELSVRERHNSKKGRSVNFNSQPRSHDECSHGKNSTNQKRNPAREGFQLVGQVTHEAA